MIALAVTGGFIGGWFVHTAYLRALYRTQANIRRQLRGGARRRR